MQSGVPSPSPDKQMRFFIKHNIPLAAKVSAENVKAGIKIELVSYLAPSNKPYPTFAMKLLIEYSVWRMAHELRQIVLQLA